MSESPFEWRSFARRPDRRRNSIHGVRDALAGRAFTPPRHLALTADAERTQLAELASAGFFSRLYSLSIGAGMSGATVRVVLDAAAALERLAIGAVSEPEQVNHGAVRVVEWHGRLGPASRMPLMRRGVALSLSANERDAPTLTHLAPTLTGLHLVWQGRGVALERTLSDRLAELRVFSLQVAGESALFERIIARLGEHLEQLELRAEQGRPDAPRSWAGRAALHALSLVGFCYRKVDWPLPALNVLSVVDIEDERIPTALVERHGGRLQRLELAMAIGACAQLGDELARCHRLESLALRRVALTTGALGDLSPLKELHLDHAVTDASALWTAIGALPALETLRIYDCDIDDDLPPAVQPCLTTLDLRGGHPDPEWLAMFIELLADTRLHVLTVVGCDVGGLEAIGTALPHLTELRFERVRRFDPRAIMGCEGALRVLSLTTRDTPAPSATEQFSEWVAAHRWPHLEWLRAPEWLAFEVLEPWLAKGDAPGLNELACHATDHAALARHLGAGSRQRLARLEVAGSVSLAGLNAMQPDAWPRTIVTR